MLWLLLLMLAPASGEDQAARRHFQAAQRYYDLGRYQDAIVEYELAYEAKQLPAFLFNIGQCYRNLHNYEDAVKSFRRYLDRSPEASNRAAVEKLIRDLDRQVEEEKRRAQPPPILAPTPKAASPPATVAPAPAPAPAASTPPLLLAPAPAPIGASLPSTAPAGGLSATAGPAAPKDHSYYKRWWFWTAVAVATVGVAVGISFAVSGSPCVDPCLDPSYHN